MTTPAAPAAPADAKPAPASTFKIANIYQYRDESGRVLFEALRLEPKSFRQRRPNPNYNPSAPKSRDNPEFLVNLDGVRRVLYRLPELMAETKTNPNKTVFVLEGEKDVDAAREIKLTATCNPMGALKWAYEYTETLRNLNVVVIADNDEPGLKHAEDVADSLLGIARAVYLIPGMPGVGPKGDFSDWLSLPAQSGLPNADAKRLAAAALVKNTPVWTGSARYKETGKPAIGPAPAPIACPASPVVQTTLDFPTAAAHAAAQAAKSTPAQSIPAASESTPAPAPAHPAPAPAASVAQSKPAPSEAKPGELWPMIETNPMVRNFMADALKIAETYKKAGWTIPDHSASVLGHLEAALHDYRNAICGGARFKKLDRVAAHESLIYMTALMMLIVDHGPTRNVEDLHGVAMGNLTSSLEAFLKSQK